MYFLVGALHLLTFRSEADYYSCFCEMTALTSKWFNFDSLSQIEATYTTYCTIPYINSEIETKFLIQPMCLPKFTILFTFYSNLATFAAERNDFFKKHDFFPQKTLFSYVFTIYNYFICILRQICFNLVLKNKFKFKIVQLANKR